MVAPCAKNTRGEGSRARRVAKNTRREGSGALRAADDSGAAINVHNENPSHSLSGSSPARTRKRRYEWSDVITTHDGRTDGRAAADSADASPGSDGRADGRTAASADASPGSDGRTDGGGRADGRRTDGRTADGRTDGGLG